MDGFSSSACFIPEEDLDVIVVGSGSAGSTAAIATARGGAKTLLLERYGFLGGTSTCMLDTFYGFYTPGSQSLKVVGGIADRVVEALDSFGACMQRPNTYGAGTGITYNSEYLKVVWERLVRESGARILLHTWMQEVVVKDERVVELVVATKGGPRRLRARFFIDATGDADLCAFAGSPCELAGEKEPGQTLTTTFKMVNVDAKQRSGLSKDDFHQRMAAAGASGRYKLPRREGSDHATPISGMFAANMTRVESYRMDGEKYSSALTSDFLTSAEIEGRAQALEYIRFLRDEIPGYKHAELVSFSTQIGVRETRRVLGEYRLTRDDVLGAAQFEDQIGLCGAPIESHHSGTGTEWQYLPDGTAVGIPFRCLIPQRLENVLVAGRCFSATHDAHASVRSMAQCMAMGEAAGTALALCVEQRKTPRTLGIPELRDILRRAGAILNRAVVEGGRN
jgi:ribulose 1,5-bisphosphate synthetase/thiazole synthase